MRRQQERYAQAGMVGLSRPEGWRPGRRRIAGKRLRIIERLKSEGLSNRAIAQRLGVNEKAIRKLLGPKGDVLEQLPLVRTASLPVSEPPPLSTASQLSAAVIEESSAATSSQQHPASHLLDARGIKRSVFVLPAVKNKNRQARVVVLNDAAQAIIERKRGQHPVYVFTWTNDDGVRNRTVRMRNSGSVNARIRAADEYPALFGKEAPPGFRDLRAHDLRHTFGRRLRSAGVSKEDRKDSLGHKSRDVTTDYSAGELMNLIRAANLLVRSKDSPTLTVLRLVA